MTSYSATQQLNFANNSDPSKGISLCIPRVFNNISWRRIKQHIIDANIGFVERVDVVSVADGKFKRAFVHFAPNKWNMRDETSRNALKALQEGKKIKLEYEAPRYWIVGISGAVRPAEAPKPHDRKTRIDLTMSVVEPVTEPVTEPVAEPVTEPVTEPVQPDADHVEVSSVPAQETDSPNPNDPVYARAMAGNATNE